MKIGILTYHCVPNFGAQLQTISTVGYVKKMGHDPIVLHWYPQDLEDMYVERIPEIQVKEHLNFTNEVLPVSKLCRSEEDLLEVIEENHIEAIIAGSDALFKYVPEVCRKRFSKKKFSYVSIKVLSVEDKHANPFFCDYYTKLHRSIPICAFSVSSQNCPYYLLNKNERLYFYEGINHYKSVTVRDEWTKDMVEELSKFRNVKITPDPVFSFNTNCYISIPTKEDILQKFNLKANYVLLSFSSKYMKRSYIKKLAEELERYEVEPVIFPMPEGLIDAGVSKRIELPLSPIDWYALIKYAKGYIGERMHPIVVSIHNSTPFFCFDEYGTVSKKMGGIFKEYKQESSKTYHILKAASLINYLYAYKTKMQYPTPREIIRKIMSFDYEKCRLFAQSYNILYNESMKQVFIDLGITK